MSTEQPEATAPVASAWRPAHVAIIGGGIAGLATAWYLEREAEKASAPLTYTLLEASDRFGGKVLSERVEGFGDGPFILEAGADAFLTRKPWAMTLARELGLGERVQFTNQAHSRTYVLRRGKPVPLPDGLRLLAPTKLIPFLRSPLFSPWGKARIGLDLVMPPRASDTDESLADFVRRRFGAEALDRVAEPMMSGVFNAVAEQQSLRATFPQFAALEREHGSVIRGLRAAERATPPSATPAFFSFPEGAQTLTDTLARQLGGDLRASTRVMGISRGAVGYALTLSAGEALGADMVVVAAPAEAVLREVAPEAAALLGGITYHGIGTLYLGFRADDVPHPLDGYGVVIPTSEGRQIDGMTWSSTKWDGRAPVGYVLLRTFFGGPATRALIERDDASLVATVRREVAGILGITAAPLFTRVYRWADGYPQYAVGHLERVAAIEAALPAGLWVTGSAYRGVGVPDCVRQAGETARQVVEMWRGLTP